MTVLLIYSIWRVSKVTLMIKQYRSNLAIQIYINFPLFDYVVLKGKSLIYTSYLVYVLLSSITSRENPCHCTKTWAATLFLLLTICWLIIAYEMQFENGAIGERVNEAYTTICTGFNKDTWKKSCIPASGDSWSLNATALITS